jgi:Topoisomerase DNA binding C4 zinc finger
MKVTFEDCLRELVITNESRGRLGDWEQRPLTRKSREEAILQSEFIKQVKGFVHETLFQLTPEKVEKARGSTEHSLGNLQKKIHSLKVVEDFNTPFAFSFFFHHWIETQKRIPLWQELWPAMHSEPYKTWFYDQLVFAFNKTHTLEQFEQAFQWRFGKYYYSALRELYVFAAFGHIYNIPLKYHLFADLVLRVDGWYENKLMYLRVPNQFEERKPVPARGGNFIVVPVAAPQPQRGAFGRLWLPSDMDAAAAALKGETLPVPTPNRAEPDRQHTQAPLCPKCQSEMRLRNGRNGEFWGCSRFPDCRGTRNI